MTRVWRLLRIMHMKSKCRGLCFGIVGILITYGFSGCTGVITRTFYIGNGYPEVISDWEPPRADENRVIIYMVEGGPNINNSTGYVDLLTIDDRVYVFRGESFSYVDLPIGTHVFTVSKVKKIPVFGPGIKLREGKYPIELEITLDNVIYIKLEKSGVDILDRGAEITPKLMKESEALSELESLVENTGFITNIRIK